MDGCPKNCASFMIPADPRFVFSWPNSGWFPAGMTFIFGIGSSENGLETFGWDRCRFLQAFPSYPKPSTPSDYPILLSSSVFLFWLLLTSLG
jgi:hypothetical protein